LFQANGLKVNFDDLGIYHRPAKSAVRSRTNPTVLKKVSMFFARFKPRSIKKRFETAKKYRIAKQQVESLK
jgi:hypothetical protein